MEKRGNGFARSVQHISSALDNPLYLHLQITVTGLVKFSNCYWNGVHTETYSTNSMCDTAARAVPTKMMWVPFEIIRITSQKPCVMQEHRREHYKTTGATYSQNLSPINNAAAQLIHY